MWQQGLRDSLNRPSVKFDISQKEKEIAELALPAIPTKFKTLFIINDPIEEIKSSLSEISFDELTERNKLIWLIFSNKNENNTHNKYIDSFDNENYKLLVDNLIKSNLDNSYKPDEKLIDKFKEDRFIYHLLSKRFGFDDSELITNFISKKMFLKIIFIRLIPLLTILIGSLLLLRTLWTVLTLRKIEWREFKSLDLDLLDMVLLISGGFVVLGEVVSPLFSITLVQLLFSNFSFELKQSLKIFFGYLFMAIPPLDYLLSNKIF